MTLGAQAGIGQTRAIKKAKYTRFVEGYSETLATQAIAIDSSKSGVVGDQRSRRSRAE